MANPKNTNPNITLYTAQTPNGQKISIALEELGLPYKVHAIKFSDNDQKADWYTEINPNGRIPAIRDETGLHDGKNDSVEPINVFESGGILYYLINKYDQDKHKISFPRGTREDYEMWNWVFWQNAGLGPMQGQSNHFTRYAAEDIPYAKKRYINECRRLYKILDKQLSTSKSGYIVGDHLSAADITSFGWVAFAAYGGVDITGFKHVMKWLEMMAARPAVSKGRNIPDGDKYEHSSQGEMKEAMEKEGKMHAEWIQKGMKEDDDQ